MANTVAATVKITPMTPQAAMTKMVQTALPQQDTLVRLTTALAAVAGKVALPEPVARAARQILGAQLQLDSTRLDGAQLRRAAETSGIFQEAKLAAGLTAEFATDIKSSLLALQTGLAKWLGPQAPVQPVASPPPPLRGQAPRAIKEAEAPPEVDAGLPELGRRLHDHAESALARVRLHQAASLPDPTNPARADWSMDLPVLIGQHQTVLHLQIHRDAPEADVGPAAERGWQLRFALNVPSLGEVGAQVSLRGKAAGVMLWSTNPETSEALEHHSAHLRAALATTGLRVGAVVVRHGEPVAQPLPSGRLLDATT